MIKETRKNRIEAAAADAIDAWFLDNEASVAEIMEKYRRHWIGRVEKVFAGDVLDPEKRTLSEMPVCWSLEKVSERYPVAGYKYVSPRWGWVKVGEKMLGEGCYWLTNHGFLYNRREGIIACPTFGQFVLPFKKVERGERIAYVKEMAPDLVKSGNYGLALLRGRTDEICNSLGIEFLDRS